MKTKLSDIRIEPTENDGYIVRVSLEMQSEKGKANDVPRSAYESKVYTASDLDNLMSQLKRFLPKKKRTPGFYEA